MDRNKWPLRIVNRNKQNDLKGLNLMLHIELLIDDDCERSMLRRKNKSQLISNNKICCKYRIFSLVYAYNCLSFVGISKYYTWHRGGAEKGNWYVYPETFLQMASFMVLFILQYQMHVARLEKLINTLDSARMKER